jgi:UDP-2,3-diacylglucosamine hydrolase
MTRWFISDLHLSETLPNTTAGLQYFFQTWPVSGDEVYILGDFFEYWLGDDAASGYQNQIAVLLKSHAGRGIKLFIMHGNRDFLIGTSFCSKAGAQLIPDPLIIRHGGQQIVLCHGDSLCTHDRGYQRFRRIIRSGWFARLALWTPLPLRKRLAQRLRQKSKTANQGKSMIIMDVATEAVADLMIATASDIMIHGHTHRPDMHRLEIDGVPKTRWVLGDWYTRGSFLRLDNNTAPDLVFFDFPVDVPERS